VCDVCSRKFKANFTLRRHLRQSHPDTVLPLVIRRHRDKLDGQFVCGVCSRTFKGNFRLSLFLVISGFVTKRLGQSFLNFGRLEIFLVEKFLSKNANFGEI